MTTRYISRRQKWLEGHRRFDRNWMGNLPSKEADPSRGALSLLLMELPAAAGTMGPMILVDWRDSSALEVL